MLVLAATARAWEIAASAAGALLAGLLAGVLVRRLGGRGERTAPERERELESLRRIAAELARTHDVEGVARALLDLSEAFGQDVGGGRILIRQKISQSDVAAMAGIARENVSRILNDWIRDKLVSRLSGYYCLEDKVRLEREIAL